MLRWVESAGIGVSSASSSSKMQQHFFPELLNVQAEVNNLREKTNTVTAGVLKSSSGLPGTSNR